jgi:uncharacterized protein YciI
VYYALMNPSWSSDDSAPLVERPAGGDEPLSWETMRERAANGRLLGKQLFVVFSKPVNGMGPIRANLPEHVAHQRRLEREGVLFAAGPLASPDGTVWNGEGLFVFRADSIEQATQYASSDPMHSVGARSFEVRPWLLNEGSIDVRIPFSTGDPEVR